MEHWTLPQNLREFLEIVILLNIYLSLFQIIVFRNSLRRKTFRFLVLRVCYGFVREPRNGPSIILHYELVESITHRKESKRYIFYSIWKCGNSNLRSLSFKKKVHEKKFDRTLTINNCRHSNSYIYCVLSGQPHNDCHISCVTMIQFLTPFHLLLFAAFLIFDKIDVFHTKLQEDLVHGSILILICCNKIFIYFCRLIELDPVK